MRKLLLTNLLAITVLSCSVESEVTQEACTCTQKTFETTYDVIYVDGLVQGVNGWNEINSIEVVCQEETDGKEAIGNGLFIEITCGNE